MAHRLVFTGKQQVAYEAFEPGEPEPGQVLTRSLCSLMSTGTENIVFNRLFDPGTHWDRWVRYPFHPGYSTVAEVVALGAGVNGLRVGDRVAHRTYHASHHRLAVTDCAVLPAGIDPQHAAWHAMAKIAFNGARSIGHGLGDTVLVIGGGPIGQMSLRWAAATGASRVVAVDPLVKRLELARRGGASAVFSCPLDELAGPLSEACGGGLPGVVIDTTGNSTVFAQALGLVAERGRVLLLGDTGTPTQQHLTGDVLNKGLTLVGAHDRHDSAGWNSVAVADLFCRLVVAGRFPLDGMITHVFDPRHCEQAYAEVNAKRGETMGVVFDWQQVA